MRRYASIFYLSCIVKKNQETLVINMKKRVVHVNAYKKGDRTHVKFIGAALKVIKKEAFASSYFMIKAFFSDSFNLFFNNTV